jgi:OmpA-OmpF porin, OOP family
MCRTVLLLLGLVGILFSSAPVLAQFRPYALTVSPYLGAQRFEGNQGVEDSSMVGLAIGYNLGRRLAAEGVIGFVDTTSSRQPETEVRGYSLRLDLLYHLSQQKLVPFLAIGGGVVSYETKGGESDQDLQAGYGLGIKYFLSENLALRADARHLFHINFNDTGNSRSGYHNLLYSAGLHFQLGGLRKLRQARVADPDGDGDGVPDHLDRCPHTPWGEVNAQGCPRDDDDDGVPDYLDRCPATPRGQVVDVRGCPEPQRR